MDNPKIESAANFIQKLITNSVKEGKWCRSAADEQPTRENIEKSIGWNLLGIYDRTEAKAVMDIVYPKLRKNGILAKLRGEEPVRPTFCEDFARDDEDDEEDEI